MSVQLIECTSYTFWRKLPHSSAKYWEHSTENEYSNILLEHYFVDVCPRKEKTKNYYVVCTAHGQDNECLALPCTMYSRRYIEKLFIIVWEFFGNEGSMWKNSMWVCVQILQLKIESSLLINHLEFFFLAIFRIERVFMRTLCVQIVLK